MNNRNKLFLDNRDNSYDFPIQNNMYMNKYRYIPNLYENLLLKAYLYFIVPQYFNEIQKHIYHNIPYIKLPIKIFTENDSKIIYLDILHIYLPFITCCSLLLLEMVRG